MPTSKAEISFESEPAARPVSGKNCIFTACGVCLVRPLDDLNFVADDKSRIATPRWFLPVSILFGTRRNSIHVTSQKAFTMGAAPGKLRSDGAETQRPIVSGGRGVNESFDRETRPI
jgi:hypothetical protein